MKDYSPTGLLLAALLTLLALYALTGCVNDALDPVFFALENEVSLTDDRGLEDNITIHRIVKTGSRYFAAANTLYTRTETGASWSVVAPPVAGALCNTLDVFGGQVYAGFFAKNGTGLGLYRCDPVTLDWSASAILDADVTGSGKQITLCKDVGGELFVSVLVSGTYTLTHSPDGSTYTAVSWGDTVPDTTLCRDVDTDGTNYWAIVGSRLYQDAGAVFSFTLYSSTPDAGGKNFGGLFLSAANTLYVSAGNGRLFSTSNGGTSWSSSSVVLYDSTDTSTVVPFSAMAEGAGGVIYAGSRGYGYYPLPGGDVTLVSAGSRAPSFTISALYNGAINSLLYDGAVTPQNLFIGTSGAGLWRGDWTGADWQWKQE